VRKGELFILWDALHNQALNTGAFISSHHKEQAQTSKVITATGGLVTVIAWALGFGNQVDNLLVLCTPVCIDLVTCINIKLFKTLDGSKI